MRPTRTRAGSSTNPTRFGRGGGSWRGGAARLRSAARTGLRRTPEARWQGTPAALRPPAPLQATAGGHLGRGQVHAAELARARSARHRARPRDESRAPGPRCTRDRAQRRPFDQLRRVGDIDRGDTAPARWHHGPPGSADAAGHGRCGRVARSPLRAGSTPYDRRGGPDRPRSSGGRPAVSVRR